MSLVVLFLQHFLLPDGDTGYLLNSQNRSVRTTLIRRHVARGNQKVKFPFLMTMSPGSFPSHPILSEKRNSRPIPARTSPETRRIFPNGAIGKLYLIFAGTPVPGG